MATQIVLSLEHILVEIFDNLAENIPYSIDALFDLHGGPRAKLSDSDPEWIDRRTLVSAALTCRAFSEPASRTIWSSLHRTGFTPLVQLYRRMKKNHYRAKRKSPPGAVHTTTGLSQRQWERLEHISARVRCVVYNTHRDQNILPSLLARYEQTERSLFPNLRILAWKTSGKVDDMRWLRTLASPSAPISELYFRLDRPGTPYWTIELRMLIDRYRHNLRRLGCDLNDHTDSLLPMLPLLLELQQIEIHNLNLSVLAALPLLPKIEVLTVHHIDGSSLLGSNTAVSHVLQQLHLILVSPSQIPRLFDSLTCPRLRALSMVLKIDPWIDDAERQLSEISTHPFVRQLATLDLNLYSTLDTAPPFSAILSPLLSLPIRNFSMITATPVSVTSQELELIARAWPLLSSFHLGVWSSYCNPMTIPPPPPSPPSSLPSLSSVLTFVRACPALRVFAIERIQDVFAEEFARVEEICRPFDSEHTLQSNLEYLDFAGRRFHWQQDLSISDPARLASILRRSFPRLREIGSSKTLEDSDPSWMDYSELQDCFQKLLQQE